MKNCVLVVDDEYGVRESLKTILEDYCVAAVKSGEDALAYLSKPNNIKVALVDYHMPGINGLMLVEKIKSIRPDIKLIFMTAYGSEDLAKAAISARVDYYIKKPFDVDEILVAVRKMITLNGFSQLCTIDDKLLWFKSFIEKNYDNTIALVDVAEALCIAPKYLSQKFIECFGVGFKEYQIRYRIERSKELLKTHMSIGQIAYGVGYKSTEAFTKAFKKYAGVAPSEWLENPRDMITMIKKGMLDKEIALINGYPSMEVFYRVFKERYGVTPDFYRT